MLEEEDPPEESSPKIGQLVSAYRKLRDERSNLKREFEKKDLELEADMDLLAAEMLKLCKELDANSIRTPQGTIIRTIKSKYWTNDWDSMYRFIKENDAFGLLEKRLHQTHMQQFLQENPNLHPAGLNVESEYTITVRRPKEK